MDLDPDPGMAIHPKNRYSNDQGLESETSSCNGTVSVQYNVAVWFEVRIRLCIESVSCSVK